LSRAHSVPLSMSPDESLGGESLSRLKAQASFRLGGRIDDLLMQGSDAPLAIMCRRDLLRAQQDQVLLQSQKAYIRKPIEKKIGLFVHKYGGEEVDYH